MSLAAIERRIAALESREAGFDTQELILQHWKKDGQREPLPPLALPEYREDEPIYIQILRQAQPG